MNIPNSLLDIYPAPDPHSENLIIKSASHKLYCPIAQMTMIKGGIGCSQFSEDFNFN